MLWCERKIFNNTLKLKNIHISYIFVAITILLWWTSPAVSRLLLTNLEPFQIIFYYNLFAIISLFFLSFFKWKLKIIKKYKKKDFMYFLWMWFLWIFLYEIFLFYAFLNTTTQEAVIANYTYPIFTVIFAGFLLKEKLNLYKFLWLFLWLFWVYITVTKWNIYNFDIWNYTWIIFWILAWLVYWLFSAIWKKFDYDTINSMLFFQIISFILITIIISIFSNFVWLNFYEFLWMIWMWFFVNWLAYIFWFLALKNWDTAKISNLVFLTPFIWLVFIYLFTWEKIYLSSLVWLIIIIIWVLIQWKFNK